MSHMARVAAGKICDPVAAFVLMEANNALFQLKNSPMILSGERIMRASSTLSGAATYFQSMFRMVAGFLYFCHGAQKIFGVFGGHKAPMVSMFGLAGILELIGGAMILIGLFTRPVAFVLCGEMAYAYFSVHSKHGAVPIVNQGELAVLYCFFFLWLIFAGPGALSVDSIIRKKD